VRPDAVQELQGTSVAVEKSLQTLIERYLEPLLGVRFLASECSTGKNHRGRIATLSIDENNRPVIIKSEEVPVRWTDKELLKLAA
jgi:hypothetical protein